MMLHGWGVKAGTAVCRRTCGWQVKQCDLSLTRAIPERLVSQSVSLQMSCLLTYYRTAMAVTITVCGPCASNYRDVHDGV